MQVQFENVNFFKNLFIFDIEFKKDKERVKGGWRNSVCSWNVVTRVGQLQGSAFSSLKKNTTYLLTVPFTCVCFYIT